MLLKMPGYSDSPDLEFKREVVGLMENRGARSAEQVVDDVGVATSQLRACRGTRPGFEA
jgi:hypothetical protein